MVKEIEDHGKSVGLELGWGKKGGGDGIRNGLMEGGCGLWDGIKKAITTFGFTNKFDAVLLVILGV